MARIGARREPGADQTGPLASAKLLEVVFSSDSVRKKQNTEAVETAAAQMVAALPAVFGADSDVICQPIRYAGADENA